MRGLLSAAAVLLFLVGIVATPPVGALNPDRSVAQFSHSGWTAEQGAPSDIKAMAQTPDGILWLGSSRGLYRFDGISFRQVRLDRPDRYRSNQVSALMATRSGDLWVGYDWGGIARYHDGRLSNANPSKPTGAVLSIVEARDGSIWVAGEQKLGGFVRRYANGRWEDIGARWGIPQQHFQSLIMARDGTLWLGMFPSVLKLTPGSKSFQTVPSFAEFILALAQDRNGRIWQVDDWGLRTIPTQPGKTPDDPTDHLLKLGQTSDAARERKMIVDQDGNLWIVNGTKGIIRLRPDQIATGDATRAKVETFAAENGLTGDRSYSLFQDREGNIWVGGQQGLDRFRNSDVVTGFFEPILRTAFAQGQDKSLFVAAGDGVYRLSGNQPAPSLLFARAEISTVCVGDSSNIWVGAYHEFVQYTGPGKPLASWKGPQKGNAVTVCAADGPGQVWASARPFLWHMDQGKWTKAESLIGKPVPSSSLLWRDGDRGILTYGAKRSLLRSRPGNQQALWPDSEAWLGFIKTIYRGPSGLLIGGEHGLARYDEKHFATLSVDQYPWLSNVTGIVQRADGMTWLITDEGIVAAPTVAMERAFAKPGIAIPHRFFGQSEGIRTGTENYTLNNAAEDESGRLWFITNKGLAWIDPRHLSNNSLPPPVIIEALSAAGARYLPLRAIKLPAGSDRVQIDYTASSLTDPLHLQFRYKLDGVDTQWIDPGQRRQAIYTNLGAGHYRFQVIAANNDGVWNKMGATMAFDIAPAFYQTWWFKLLIALLIGLLLWCAYALRSRQVARLTRMRMEDRINERERIARDLHDTLLQGFQGLMLNFQRVADHLPAESDSRALMDHALERGDDVLLEGRERVRSLRIAAAPVDLPAALRDLASRAAAASALTIEVTSQGHAIAICAPVAEEILQIGSEAVFNTIRHAQADRVEIAITFGRNMIAICFRDNGIGIAPALRASKAQEGHFGLIGMQERAAEISSSLDIKEAAGGGTEILLSVPTAIAFSPIWARWRR